MKIFICAIMKNEEKNICRFYESCKDADGIYVLDTGSTDNSVKLLQSMGQNVVVAETKYENFRFDVARNDAIALLPKEDAWVIHLDLDEFLVGDWKSELSELTNATNVSYMYVFNRIEGQPGIHFVANKITRNGMYKFKFPIHENIYTTSPEVKVHASKFHIEQEQDTTKKRDYRTILQSAVKEYPDEDILKFYLLKENFIAGNYGVCIDGAMEIIRTKTSDYGLVACLIAARSFEALGVPAMKEEWLLRGVQQSPFRREAYMELLRLYASQDRLDDAFWAGNNIFHIRNRPFDFLEMTEAWTKEPHAIFADVCNKLGLRDILKEHVKVLNDVIPMRLPGPMRDGLNALIGYLTGNNIVMAEIGSYAGESAEMFAASEKIAKVYAIDPWSDDIQCEYVTFKNMKFVESLFDERTGANPKIVKMKTDSTTAVSAIEEVDFVYIDAVHTFEAMTNDIKNWYSKVKPGGFIGGHDYHSDGFPGVFRAVNEFCDTNNLNRPFVFPDSSWLVKKPK